MFESGEETKFYYDVYSGWLIVGEEARLDHTQAMERSGFPADIRPFEEVLNDKSLVLPEQGLGNTIDWAEEPLHAYTSAGRWAINMARRTEHGGLNEVDKHLVRRLFKLGLLASERRISHPARFGGLSGFYRAMEIDNSKRTFPDLMPEDAALYLINLSDELGQVPDEAWLTEEATKDKCKPSPVVLRDRIGMGISRFRSEYGYWQPHDFSDEDSLDFEVCFMEANSGLSSTQFELDEMFSVLRKGPSAHGIKKRFGGLRVFRQQAVTAYEADQKLRDATIDRLKHTAESDKFFRNMLPKHSTLEERLSIFGRLSAINQILPALTQEEVAAILQRSPSDAMFIHELKKYSSKINAGALNQASLEAGLFKSSWRKPGYLDGFKIETIVFERLQALRGAISEEEIHLMQESVVRGIEFLWANQNIVKDRLYWREPHFALMRKKNVIPKRKLFKKIFVNTQLYGEIIYAGFHRQKKEYEVKKNELLSAIEIGLGDSSIPAELFDDIEPENISDRIARYARFTVITDLEASGQIGKLIPQRKIAISSLTSGNFNQQVKRAANGRGLDIHEIELTASMLGLSEFVYTEQRRKHFANYTLVHRNRRDRKKPQANIDSV